MSPLDALIWAIIGLAIVVMLGIGALVAVLAVTGIRNAWATRPEKPKASAHYKAAGDAEWLTGRASQPYRSMDVARELRHMKADGITRAAIDNELRKVYDDEAKA